MSKRLDNEIIDALNNRMMFEDYQRRKYVDEQIVKPRRFIGFQNMNTWRKLMQFIEKQAERINFEPV